MNSTSSTRTLVNPIEVERSKVLQIVLMPAFGAIATVSTLFNFSWLSKIKADPKETSTGSTGFNLVLYSKPIRDRRPTSSSSSPVLSKAKSMALICDDDGLLFLLVS